MRKGMWKKGLTVAMAAAMLAGPVSVPAVFNNGVAVVKADETNKEQDIYVLMNIPYADFYKAELNKNDVKVDVTTSATKAKTRSTISQWILSCRQYWRAYFRNHLSCKDQSLSRSMPISSINLSQSITMITNPQKVSFPVILF